LGLGASSAARAQDFAQSWLDRVTHEAREAAPPSATAAGVRFVLGALAYHDDNLYLEEDEEDDDWVIVPYLGGRVDYAEPSFDAAADALLSYKRYLDQEDESDDEERVYGRVRFAGAHLQLELAQIFRHESDPIDAVFAERAERFVSDTAPRVGVRFNNLYSMEASANVEWVRFLDDPLNDADNVNVRADLSFIYTGAGGIDFLGQGGVLAIRYRSSDGPPDVDGFYARAGLRGDVMPRLSVEALAGGTRAESDDLPGADSEEVSTADALVRLKYAATEQVTAWADYTRMVTFANPDPFQVVNRWLGIVEYQGADRLVLRGRLQYDDVSGALGTDRTFFSAGASFSYLMEMRATLDGGVTWRTGEVDVPGGTEFENLIFHVGVAFTN
jgi:hypothetical protein